MIKHDGIVIAINGDGTARVRIVQASACSACKAKAMCASAESKEKEMGVILLGDEVKVGDAVEVMVQQKMGWKAVILAYLLPFVVLIAVLLVGNSCFDVREEILGTIALCAMAVYYLVLGLFKDRLQKEFSFTARKKM